MSARKIASLGLIDRRQFMQLSAGSLVLVAASCRRGGDPAYRRGSTVIMAVSSVNDIKPDESDLDFLVFSPLTELDEHGALTTADPDVLDAVYRELMAIFREDAPVTFLFPQTQSYFVNKRIRGLDGRYWPDPVQHMEHLWIEGEHR